MRSPGKRKNRSNLNSSPTSTSNAAALFEARKVGGEIISILAHRICLVCRAASKSFLLLLLRLPFSPDKVNGLARVVVGELTGKQSGN